jgi:hypothetical protein
MRGLGKRLAAQTLSQILTFGLCASSTESAMQQQSQRPAPVVREKTSPTDDCHTPQYYLGKSHLSYARGVSWFQTHPPFYEHMVSGECEIMFLPKKDNYVMQSSEFEQMKKVRPETL